MAQHNETGKLGEEIAARFLSEKGYTVICSNWHFGKGEIDIVSQKDNIMIFVEVKTRASSDFGEPETFVTKKKQRLIIRTANAYLRSKNIELESRFDIISVITGKDNIGIQHIEDAFNQLI